MTNNKITLHERIARLETKMDMICESIKSLNEKVDGLSACANETKPRIRLFDKIVSAIVAFFVAFSFSLIYKK